MRDLWLKIAHTSGAKVYTLAISVLILVITARWLGPEGRGIIAVATTWVGLFSTVGHLSLGQVAIHRATELRQKVWLPSTLGSLLLLTTIITGFGWIIALGLYLFTGGTIFSQLAPEVLAVGFLALPFMIWEQYGSSLLMSVDRISIYNNAQLIGRTVGIMVLVCFLVLNLGMVGVLVAILTAQVIVAVAGVRYLFGCAQEPVRPDFQTIKGLLTGGLKLHLNAIGTFLILSVNVLIVSYYRGLAETGYYQLAAQLIGVLFIIPTAASMVLYGKVAQLGPDAAWAYQRQVLVFMSLGMVGIVVGAEIVGPPVILLVVGPSFASAVGVFQLLLLALVGMTFSAVMGPQWIGRGLFWQVALMTLALGVLNLIVSLLFVPNFGMYGAVWGILTIYTVSVFVNGGMAVYCEARLRRIREMSREPIVSTTLQTVRK